MYNLFQSEHQTQDTMQSLIQEQEANKQLHKDAAQFRLQKTHPQYTDQKHRTVLSDLKFHKHLMYYYFQPKYR